MKVMKGMKLPPPAALRESVPRLLNDKQIGWAWKRVTWPEIIPG